MKIPLFLVAASVASSSQLTPRAFEPVRLGDIAPAGWLAEQLVVQANSLSGYLAKSTFPGADIINRSVWIGGDGANNYGATQWLPYWTNGNVPLVLARVRKHTPPSRPPPPQIIITKVTSLPGRWRYCGRLT